MIRALLVCLTFLSQILLINCSSKVKDQVASPAMISPTYPGPPEISYCSGPASFSDSVTISGSAKYQAREPFYISAQNSGLGAAGTARPIRYAEVRITNSANELVQCTETTSSGAFSFTLPRGDGVFTVSVMSRSNNSFNKASVFNAPEQNTLYSLSTTLIASATQDIGELIAGVDPNLGLLGGAFNILDQILNANDFIRSKASNCSSNFSGCPSFVVAPKVNIYWKMGFNPGSYFDEGPLSFYLPGYSRLFILGGVNGDVNSSDTDHFDNSVIIHEFGHFLEDSVFISDSPGGEHNGNKVIDPRLAWSEGWGNFIQAAVRNDSYYMDTSGNIDGTTKFLFRVDLEPNGASAELDKPVFDGEGNFREFSVSRLLFDVTDSGGDDAIDDGFEALWASLVSPTGFAYSQLAFRDIGVVHNFVHNILSPQQDWSTLRTSEKHGNTAAQLRKEYGQYISTTPANCNLTSSPFTIDPLNIPTDSGNFSTSHLLKNNDFYHIKHLGGDLILALNYKTPSGVEADLDLYIYGEDAVYGDNFLSFSRDDPATSSSGDIETETISIPGLAAGNYLVNVMVYTGNASVGSTTNYELKLQGSNLCPDTVP